MSWTAREPGLESRGVGKTPSERLWKLDSNVHSKKSVSKVVSVDEQAYEQEAVRAEHEDGVDETPEFRATVEMEIQAKVDANHPDGIVDTSEDRIYGVTLAQEERIRAREEELDRISVQAAFGRQEGGRSERER